MAQPAAEKRSALTLRERVFASFLFANGLNNTKAYLAMAAELGRPVTESTANSMGSRIRSRICQTAEFRAILAVRGIDEMTLADDLDRLRHIKRPAFSRDGEIIGEYDDGQVQLGAAKLIGDALDVVKPAEVTIPLNITIGDPPKPVETEAGADA